MKSHTCDVVSIHAPSSGTQECENESLRNSVDYLRSQQEKGFPWLRKSLTLKRPANDAVKCHRRKSLESRSAEQFIDSMPYYLVRLDFYSENRSIS